MRQLFVLLGLVMPIGVASAQTFGEITGEVTDQSGAIAPNASVTATNTATNGARTTLTNASGIYSFPAMVPGPYQVKVEAPIRSRGWDHGDPRPARSSASWPLPCRRTGHW